MGEAAQLSKDRTGYLYIRSTVAAAGSHGPSRQRKRLGHPPLALLPLLLLLFLAVATVPRSASAAASLSLERQLLEEAYTPESQEWIIKHRRSAGGEVHPRRQQL
jgi:hypothetical protein